MKNHSVKTWRKRALSAAAMSFVASATVVSLTPAQAAHDGVVISHKGLSIGGDKDLLEELIALDAGDIEELRRELAHAREEVLDAVDEVREAREEAKSAPGGTMVLKAAFGVARVTVRRSVDEAFDEVRAELADAENRLAARREAVGEAEFAETTKAIAVIRTGLRDIEGALEVLISEMRA